MAFFSKWLESNKAAKILWFINYYKNIHNSLVDTNIFWATNPNKSVNAKLKGTPEYKLTNLSGLSKVELVTLIENIDDSDYRFLINSSFGGEVCSSLQLWRKTPKKRMRSNDNSITFDGKHITASQPKRARKS